MPRGVLWTGPSNGGSTKDPLSLALTLREAWTSTPPDGLDASQACAISDSGWLIEPNQATAEHAGGKLVLQRKGADWHLSEAIAPTKAYTGDCG